MAIKVAKKKGPKIIDAEDTPEVAEEVAEAAPEVAEAAEEAPEVVRQPKVKAQTDMVEFSTFEEIDPSPTIGGYSFAQELSLTKLSAKTNYVIPRYVAEVLVDRKKGMILPG